MIPRENYSLFGKRPLNQAAVVNRIEVESIIPGNAQISGQFAQMIVTDESGVRIFVFRHIRASG